VLHELQDAGLPCEKISYAYKKTHDIKVELLGREGKMEVKARANGFATIYKWLEPVDLLILRADRKPALAVVPIATLIELMKK
jgi:hypothetical protein